METRRLVAGVLVLAIVLAVGALAASGYLNNFLNLSAMENQTTGEYCEFNCGFKCLKFEIGEEGGRALAKARFMNGMSSEIYVDSVACLGEDIGHREMPGEGVVNYPLIIGGYEEGAVVVPCWDLTDVKKGEIREVFVYVKYRYGTEIDQCEVAVAKISGIVK